MKAQQFSLYIKNAALGLAVTATMLAVLEMSVRVVPATWLPVGATVVPDVAPVDRGSKALRKNGYRGKRRCTDCAQKPIRIVTMGGSSTYGVPMHYSAKTYSAVLQNLLQHQRPHDRFEVLNGGIAGFGIWQINEALERHILADAPDIVMLCAWFNDSSGIPGWYGFPGLSDLEAYEEVQKLRQIEGHSAYQLLRKSRAYALLRYGLQRLRQGLAPTPQGPAERKRKKPRSSPEEFQIGVEHFLALAEKHKFLPIFVTEALNRTAPWAEAREKNRYYQVLESLSLKHGVPIVDTLTPLAARRDEWLFYDFIHPNEHGHAIIAETIAESLFRNGWHTPRSREWFAQRGITINH